MIFFWNWVKFFVCWFEVFFWKLVVVDVVFFDLFENVVIEVIFGEFGIV